MPANIVWPLAPCSANATHHTQSSTFARQHQARRRRWNGAKCSCCTDGDSVASSNSFCTSCVLRCFCACKNARLGRVALITASQGGRRSRTCTCQSFGSDQGHGASSSSASSAAFLPSAAATLTSLFPVWVAAACGLALFKPELFLWFKKEFITAGLALTMLGMGSTLRVSDFLSILQAPTKLMIGLSLQYTVMPFLGFIISRVAGLPPPFAIGVILVSCCPGGTASNIVTYLARADVALSVMMTSCSTLAAIIATPLLTKALAGTLVAVNAWSLFLSTLQVVLLPVLLGVAAKECAPNVVAATSPYSPLLASVCVALICASVIAHNAAAVLHSGATLLSSLLTLHAGGFFLGYWLSRVMGMGERACRTNSIEVGMQNSTLGAVLAALHFSDPLTATPCAVSACLHACLGSLLAAVWQRVPVGDDDV